MSENLSSAQQNELSQTQHQLAASEENFRTFFDSLDYFLFVLDNNANMLRVNHTVKERLGYTDTELIGQSVLMVHPPQRHAEAGQIVSDMLAGRCEFCPVPLQAKDGRLIPVETRVVAGRWNGEAALFGISKDISVIRESEEKFSRVFNANPALMALSSVEEGRIFEINDTFLETLGFSRDQVIGRTVAELNLFVDPDFRQRFKSEVECSTRARDMETRVRARDGRIIHGLFSAELIHLQDRDLMLSVMLDISSRKQTEQALQQAKEAAEKSDQEKQESLNKLNAITDSAQDAILMMGSNGEISFWNPAAEKIFGYSAQEALGQNLHLLLAPARYHADHLNAFPEFVRRGIGDAIGRTLELNARHKQGHEFPISLSLSAVPLQNSWHAVGIVRDISQLKHVQSELLAAKDAAEQADRAKSIFLATMSHDLRTPLNSICGFTEILQRQLSGPLNEAQNRQLNLINESARHLLDLINDILDLSKVESGELVINPIPFALPTLLERIEQRVRPLADKKALTLTLDIAAKTVNVFADPLRVEQVLTNLVGNAIKFTETGSIAITCRTEEDGVRISVSDSGIGIVSDDLEHVFEPFQQIDTQLGRKSNGTGLGLAICKQLVNLMKGKIGVESTPGVGSCFWIVLPTAPAEGSDDCPANSGNTESVEKNSQPKPQNSAATRLLLADDNALNREVTEMLLEDLGYAFDSVENGQQVLERLAEKDYALILMDSQMPVMDGLAASRQIRHQYSAAQLPIIAMTAETGDNDRNNCLAAGMNDYLSKPVSLEQLAETIKRWLPGRRSPDKE